MRNASLRICLAVFVWAVTVPVLARAQVSDVQGFLAATEKAGRPGSVVRGTGTISVNGLQGKSEDRIVVLQNPAGDRYVEMQKAGVRLLILANGKSAFLVDAAHKSPTEAKREIAIAGTDFTREDLEPFAASHYGDARIADESSIQRTMSMEPRGSQYVLVVTTFEKAKDVPTKSLLYVETVKNLAKMLRQGDHVQVAGAWLPGTISIEQFQLRTGAEIKLTWKEDAAPPAVFEKAALGKPSPITW